MGVKDGFMGASMLLKVALILIIVSNVCNWIAFCTASWGYTDNLLVNPNEIGVGIWRRCGLTGSCSDRDGLREKWIMAFQGFAIFGYVGINMVMLLIILFLFVGACKRNGEVKMGAIITAFVTAICYAAAVFIFNSESNENVLRPEDYKLGFSFDLAIIALVLEAITGVLLIVDGKGGSTSPAR
ncbi:hypothetical protein BaRGS_00038415 [Batillaria attramentaria]|uniref:Uncharacterized protein n=1 Tax=Batillaria attramentaria TaxID=370345 RepID=A0ABD0J5U5_9CAEN